MEYGEHPAVHKDRIEASLSCEQIDYLVAEVDARVAGFGVLILDPHVPGWPEISPVPQAIDIQVAADSRGLGAGTAMVEEMAERARRRNAPYLYLGVEPEHNPRALELYRRLGFEAMQDRPRPEEWAYTDSAGHYHSGQVEIIDMRLKL